MNLAKKSGLTWLSYAMAVTSFLSALAVISSGILLNGIQLKTIAKTIPAIEFIQGPDSVEFWVGCPMLLYTGFCLLRTMIELKTMTAVTLSLGLICKFLCIFGLIMEGPDLYHIRLIRSRECTGQDYTRNCDEVNKLHTLYCTIVVFLIVGINLTFVATLSCFTTLFQATCPASQNNNCSYPLHDRTSRPPVYSPCTEEIRGSQENETQPIPPPPYSRHEELIAE